jgi:sialic acid synthase SpsE
MSTIILDISANTTRNDNAYATKMIDAIKAIDTGKHKIIFKTQLFESAGDNAVMSFDHFDHIYNTCKDNGYECTSSVFDVQSLEFLLNYKIPFVKIACRPDLYWLIGEVPRKVPVYFSIPEYTDDLKYFIEGDRVMACVSKYPADVNEYSELFSRTSLWDAVSDHTKDLELFNYYHPDFIEMHYCLEDSTGLDAESGVCKTPSMLKEIL